MTEFSNQINNNQNKIKYIGLNNQGSTCYLNTLIQSLFMTPEFRTNILKWEYNPQINPKPEESIPYQLQRLFALLQHPIRKSEKTENLTHSFGWSFTDVFVQQDIEELCRVLFEAIQISMKSEDNSEENFINNLYLGEYSSVIRCNECENLSLNKDTFLDLNLPISNEFDNIHNKSLEMALMNFIKPENLEGNNQYFCSKCNKKVNATKFIKFDKFPQILFIQIGRFAYDIENDKKIKIYDKVNFPLLLNLNKYSKEYKDVIYNPEISENDQKCLEDDESIIEEYKKDGEFVYELFSIMIHLGGESSGHYYAYIKSFEDNKWYNFNDDTVSELDKNKISETFGGETGMNGSLWNFRKKEETAYYLMYRKINKEKQYEQKDMVLNENLLQYIKEEKEKELIEEEKRQEKLNRMTLRIRSKNELKLININKLFTIKQLKDKIINDFKLPQNQYDFTLRSYSEVKGEKYDYIKGEDDDIIENSNIEEYFTYIIQFKENGQFPVYDKFALNFSLFLWEDNKLLFQQPNEKKNIFDLDLKSVKFSCKKDISISELKQQICISLNIDMDYFNTNALLFNSTSTFVSDVVFSLVNFSEFNDLYTSISEIFKLTENKILIEFVPYLNLVNSNWINIIHQYSTHIECIVEYKDERYPQKSFMGFNKYMKVSDVFQNFYLFKSSEKHDFFKKTKNGEIVINENDTLIDIISQDEVSLHLIGQINQFEKDKIKISVFLCLPYYETFSIYPYQYITIFDDYVANKEMTLTELKNICLNEVNNKQLLSDKSLLSDLNKIYIRDYSSGRPKKIYNETLTLDDADIESGMKLLIQILDNSLDIINILPSSPIIISFRYFDSNKFTLTKPVDILFYSSNDNEALCNSILRNFPSLEEIGNIEVMTLFNCENVSLNNILQRKFHNMSEYLKYEISSYPLLLNKSGLMCIVKDARDKIHFIKENNTITEEKEEHIEEDEKESSKEKESKYILKFSSSEKLPDLKQETKKTKENRIKEKSLVIKVKSEKEKDEDDKKEEKIDKSDDAEEGYCNVNNNKQNELYEGDLGDEDEDFIMPLI